jgi:choline dehydrogenase-like flavoprotein
VIPPKDRLILDGAAALGWEAAPTERNAGPCTDCGSCGFGCRRGAKRSGPRSHLAAAARDGARFLVEARVDSVLLVGGRTAGVAGRLLDAGGRRSRPFVARAPRVVVAAGALRTPLLLERSGIDHPQLGRNLRLHPVVVVTARMADPVEMWVGPTQAARSLQFWRPGPAAGGAPAHGGFVIESAPPHPGLIASALPWSGGEADLARMGEVRNEAPLIGIMRDTGSGRVRWTRGGHPRIDYRLDAAARATARRALVEMARLAHAAGAVELTAVATPAVRWVRDRGDDLADLQRRILRIGLASNRISLFSAHQMGSARAGGDPARHACDPFGRVRGSRADDGATVPGLYVGDASLFPGAPGVNPMVTVMALAERTARAVLEDARG